MLKSLRGLKLLINKLELQWLSISPIWKPILPKCMWGAINQRGNVVYANLLLESPCQGKVAF